MAAHINKRKVLTAKQVVEIVKAARMGVFVPEIARFYGISFGTCRGILEKELVGKEHIRYQKYGTKRYSWKDPIVKEQLKALVEEGYDDDEIARLWKTSCIAIGKGRSICGFVKFNRIVAKGHNSPHEYSHLDNVENKEELKQGSLFGAEVIEPQTFAEDHPFNRKKTKVIEPSQREEEKMTVCFHDPNKTCLESKRKLVEMLNWKLVAMRLQNPNHLYKVLVNEGEDYYQLLKADIYNDLVEVSWVRTVSAKVTN